MSFDVAICNGACVCGWLFFFQAEDGIRDGTVTGVQTCALPISEWRLFFAACINVRQSEFPGHIEIHLVRGQCKFTPDRALYFYIDLRSIEGRFIWYFYIVDRGFLHGRTDHFFRLQPKLWFIHIFLSEAFGIMQ